jgi:dynein light chain LC8-type
MADDMLQVCISVAQKHISSCENWREGGDEAVAAMKEALDAQFGTNWTVAVGKHFGSKVTHEAKHFCNFYLGDLCVLIFRT